MPKCKPLGQFYFDHLKTSQVEKFCRRMIKKSWDFFLVQNYVFTSEWKFLWGWFNFREREREWTKKPLRLFCFTQDLVYNFSQATLIISVGFCNFFLVYIPRTNLDSPLAFPLWFLLKRVNWFEWTFLWLWKLSILGQFDFLKLSTFLFK